MSHLVKSGSAQICKATVSVVLNCSSEIKTSLTDVCVVVLDSVSRYKTCASVGMARTL